MNAGGVLNTCKSNEAFKTDFFGMKFFIKQGYKDSNLEMTESESVALPFGDSPI